MQHMKQPISKQNARLKALEAFLYEINLGLKLSHPNIVRLIGVVEKDLTETLMVMELCPEGTLQSWIKNCNGEQISIKKLISIALDIAHGLNFIHDSGVLHRDLKSENILLGKTLNALIADLGCAQSDSLVERVESIVVSMNMKDKRYAAPEEVGKDSKKKITRKSDIYSLGILLWELFAGKDWYEGKTDKEWRQEIKKGLTDPIPATCPANFGQLILDCREKDPENRPTANQVVNRLESMLLEIGDGLEVLIPRIEGQLASYRDVLEEYTPSSVEGNSKDPKKLTIDDALSRFVEDPEQCMVVMGPGGLGKSLSCFKFGSLLLKKARSQSNEGNEGKSEGWLPVYLRFGQKEWSHKGIPQAIERAFKELHIEFDQSLVKCARILFVFDAYDELSGHSAGNLPSLLGLDRFPNSKLLITCRPDTVPKGEIPEHLGVKGKIRIENLLPLQDTDQIIKLLDKKNFLG